MVALTSNAEGVAAGQPWAQPKEQWRKAAASPNGASQHFCVAPSGLVEFGWTSDLGLRSLALPTAKACLRRRVAAKNHSTNALADAAQRILLEKQVLGRL